MSALPISVSNDQFQYLTKFKIIPVADIQFVKGDCPEVSVNNVRKDSKQVLKDQPKLKAAIKIDCEEKIANSTDVFCLLADASSINTEKVLSIDDQIVLVKGPCINHDKCSTLRSSTSDNTDPESSTNKPENKSSDQLDAENKNTRSVSFY